MCAGNGEITAPAEQNKLPGAPCMQRRDLQADQEIQVGEQYRHGFRIKSFTFWGKTYIIPVSGTFLSVF